VSSKLSFFLQVSHKKNYVEFLSQASYNPAYLILYNLIVLKVFGNEYKL